MMLMIYEQEKKQYFKLIFENLAIVMILKYLQIINWHFLLKLPLYTYI